MKQSAKQGPDIDCLGLGIIPVDFLYTVEKYPDVEQKVDAIDFRMQGGGPVGTAMIGLARLGRKTAMIAAVGDDLMGRLSIDELRAAKVSHRFMITKKRPSACASGFIEANSGRRTMVLSRSITVRPSDLTLVSYPIPAVVHLDGRDMPATMKMARWARRVGAIVSFDIGSIRNDVTDVLPLVDHLVVADAYAFPYTGRKTARQAIESLAQICPGSIVITEGIKGSTGWEKGTLVHQKAYCVDTVDTTGAGDAFHAGYLFGLLNRCEMCERLRLGAGVAALNCTRLGARSGLPTRRQLSRFLNDSLVTYD
ncbi:MAG: carbohydrate kinase family protein [Candidatus Zixiibacteriota bacterium]